MKQYSPKSITELEKATAKTDRAIKWLAIASAFLLSVVIAGIVVLIVSIING